MLIDHIQSDEARGYLTTIRRNGDYLLDIINDILDLSKMESGKFEIDIDSVDVIALLNEVVKQNESYINQCCCQTLLELPESADEIFIHGDKQRLIQVITNLLSNAAKFSPEGAQITIRLELFDKSVRISIIDNGIGIPVDQQNQLFKKFHQIGRPKNELPGTGLGLIICKYIIEAHHGSIGFNSIPGQETMFYFDLDIVNS
jgi:signal transduction histidine kinase